MPAETPACQLGFLHRAVLSEVITAEAENAALYGTAGTNQDHWNYSGSGFVDGMTSAGAGAEFEITVRRTEAMRPLSVTAMAPRPRKT